MPKWTLGTYGRSAGDFTSSELPEPGSSGFPDHPDQRMIGVEQLSVGDCDLRVCVGAGRTNLNIWFSWVGFTKRTAGFTATKKIIKY